MYIEEQKPVEVKQEQALEMMNLEPLNYAERQEIKELSLKFLGSSSKWKKLVENGRPLQVRSENGIPMTRLARVNERIMLLQLREVEAEFNKRQEEAAQAKEAAQAAVNAAGSSGS
jgi:hypothetical protein